MHSAEMFATAAKADNEYRKNDDNDGESDHELKRASCRKRQKRQVFSVGFLNAELETQYTVQLD